MVKSPKGGVQARSVARLRAVQALYQMDLAGTDLNLVIATYQTGKLPVEDEDTEEELAASDATFFAELVRGVVRRQRDIDPVIDEQLAIGWRLVRIESTLRAILRAAVFELIDRPDVPGRVVINEYINVAHAFFQEEEPKVVNGVLDRLARRYRPEEFAVKGGV